MKFSEDLAAVHAYLCSDGMVKQFGKHYHIKFTNITQELLEDFNKRFFREFGIKPKEYKEKHITRLLIYDKTLFLELIKFGPYDSRNWAAPIKFLTKNTASIWLRSFFDAEAWVELQKAKNRAVRVDCINLDGLQQISNLLQSFGIRSQITCRKQNYMWRLNICGKENLKKFADKIGFLHISKNNLLNEAANSYETYEWKIPESKQELLNFIKENGRLRKSRKEIRFFSIKAYNLIRLKKVLKAYKIHSKVQGPWLNSAKREYYCLIIREKEVNKL